jgi:hypothetical protein
MAGQLKVNGVTLATEESGTVTLEAPQIKDSSNNVILDQSGTTPVLKNVEVVNNSSMMFRNKIINGDMRIAQRSTSVSSFSADGGGSGGFKTLDRFYHELGSAGTYTLSQNSITDLSGFKKSLKVLCTASATPSGTAQFNVHQRIESNNFYDLAFGTSSAKSITYSFWVKTNVDGDYILWFLNVPDQRMTSKKYSISSSETGVWKYISVTVNGDTGGSVFDADNSHAFQVRHVLASGGDYTSGTYMDGTWQTVSGNTGNVYAGQTANVSSDVNNYYEITGVQLEVGNQATPFEHRPYGTELALCQRYFQSIQLHGLFVFPYSVNYALLYAPLLVPLRSSSSVSLSKTARVIRITTPEILDYHIDGGNVYNGSGDWANTLAIFGKTQTDGGLSNLGIVINKSGSGNFPDQEPLLITGIVNSTQDDYNENGGYLKVECEL